MLYLGLEIGGTKLQAGLGDGKGSLTQLLRVRAEPELGAERIRQQLLELVANLFVTAKVSPNDIRAVGIGFGGPVDIGNGLAVCSHQVAGWDRFPIIRWFETELGIKAVLGNDADLAGLAEARLGAGRGYSPIVYMNIGSGIGGAIIIGEQLYFAQGLGAAEIGHMRIAPASGAGPWRTLESLASGWAMQRIAREEAIKPDSSLRRFCQNDPKTMTTEQLVEAVRAGDSNAVAIWDRAISYLAVAIANIIAVLDPQRFVIGGGVAEAGPLLFDRLREKLEDQIFLPFAGSCEIVPAALSENVVVHGALLQASTSF